MISSRRARRAAGLLVVALLASLLAVVGASPAGATQGGPDAFGYVFIDDQTPGGPTFSYQDISGTGSTIVSGDDAAVTTPTPFPVQLYGSVVNSVGVSTNGVVSTNANSSLANTCQPNLGETFGDAIFLQWDDLITTVRTQTFGVAPNRTFVIQWNGIYYPGFGSVDFNVTFTEGSTTIKVRYQTVSGTGGNATVGMQQNDGNGAFLPYSCNTPNSVVAPRAVDFILGPPPTTTEVTVTASTPKAVEGGAPGAFTFSRTGDKSNNLTVGYQLTGTATSGSDYDPPGTVTIPAGQSTVVAPLNALADNVADDGETVTVVVSDGAGYSAGQPAQATVTINETGAAPAACANAPVSSYSDRNAVPAHTLNIDCITAYGVAEGFTDGTYRPASPVTRPQMASLIARVMHAAGVTLPASPPDAFPGDDAGSPHELSINQLAALGVLDATTGQQGNKFDVGADMRRDDMAQLLVNAYEVITGSPLPPGDNAFTDDEGNDNEAAINALFKAGVVEGTGGGLYDPSGSVTRGQMASFLSRYIQVLVDAGFLQPLP